MISNRELKEEIEQLTAQNLTLSDELKQLKELLKRQHESQDQRGQEGRNGGSNEQNQNSSGQGLSGQNKPQQQNAGGQSGGQSGGQIGSMHIASVANEFLQLKAMTNALEQKMNHFIQNQTGGGQLRQEDVTYLLLNMMNGMIDWTIEYVARNQSGQDGQGQGQGGQGGQGGQNNQGQNGQNN